MPDAGVPAESLAIVEVIAGAIRRELGGEVDAYPGRRDPDQADPLNRAFRAVVRAVLAGVGVPGVALGAATSATLLAVAARRLRAEGWDDHQARTLVQEEAGSPDDWLAFLILSSRPQIQPLLDPDGP